MSKHNDQLVDAHNAENGWNRCRFCESPVYGQTTCHLCFYLLSEDADALRLIAAWMETINMEPHAAAYAVSREREKAAQ